MKPALRILENRATKEDLHDVLQNPNEFSPVVVAKAIAKEYTTDKEFYLDMINKLSTTNKIDDGLFIPIVLSTVDLESMCNKDDIETIARFFNLFKRYCNKYKEETNE